MKLIEKLTNIKKLFSFLKWVKKGNAEEKIKEEIKEEVKEAIKK